jgi:hypothetical protein
MPPEAKADSEANSGRVVAGEPLRIGFLGFGEAGYELAKGLKEAGGGEIASAAAKARRGPRLLKARRKKSAQIIWQALKRSSRYRI